MTGDMKEPVSCHGHLDKFSRLVLISGADGEAEGKAQRDVQRARRRGGGSGGRGLERCACQSEY